jgi:holo-[acyl-carrier protein] synthase
VSIVGIGVDVVDVARLGQRLARVPRLAEKLFTPAERLLPLRSLAGRFAAKEAVGKALGNPGDLSWHDVEVTRPDGAAPVLVVRGAAAERGAALGVGAWHLSLSHDAGIATAFVVLETA